MSEPVFNPFWEKKVWGHVHHIFACPQASVSYLAVQAGTRCSIHYHEDRFNQFYVLAGRIVIEVWDDLLDPVDFTADMVEKPDKRIVLDAGRSFAGRLAAVGPKRLHRFRVLASGNLIETYWALPYKSVRYDDIRRFDEGGFDDQTQLKKELGL